jgi:hypothetical protein
MNWQPPPNRPGQPPGGGQPPGAGQPPDGGGGYPPPGGAAPQIPVAAESKDLSLYQLLQVDKDAHVTIIRYAYRFLAAMYHPDNGETGDAERFRVITEAWKTLSDEGKRAAYDMSLGLQEQTKGKASGAPKPKINEYGRDSMPNLPKTGITFNEIELRMAILQVLLAARKKRTNGGASGKMLMDILNLDNITEIEFALWYLREKKWIETGERVFMITVHGLDYLTEQLAAPQMIVSAPAAEKRVDSILNSGLPAVIQRNSNQR